MKLIFAILALFAIPTSVLADSAFSDASSLTSIATAGGADTATFDTGFSFDAWSAPSESFAGVQIDMRVRNVSGADAVEPSNFGSDQAFADTFSNTTTDNVSLAQTSGADFGSGLSFAAGDAGFTFITFGGGSADAEANDE